MNRLKYIIFIFIFIVYVLCFNVATVKAVYCSGACGAGCRTCTVSGATGCKAVLGSNEEKCVIGSSGCNTYCCFDRYCNGGCNPVSQDGGCGNCIGYRTCSCTPSGGCPPSTPGSIYRTVHRSGSGTRVTCENPCHPRPSPCSYDYYENSPPTCTLTVTKANIYYPESTPVTLTVIDNDPGDTVRLTSLTYSNPNCGKITSGLIVNGPIKVYPNTVQSKIGTFTSGDKPIGYNHNHVCTTTITAQVRDDAGDAEDTSATSACSTTVNVTYRPPKINSVKIIDRNEAEVGGGLIGFATEEESKNLLNYGNIYVGSNNIRDTFKCGSTSISGTGVFECNDKVGLVSDHNPLEVIIEAEDVLDNNLVGLTFRFKEVNATLPMDKALMAGYRHPKTVDIGSNKNVEWYDISLGLTNAPLTSPYFAYGVQPTGSSTNSRLKVISIKEYFLNSYTNPIPALDNDYANWRNYYWSLPTTNNESTICVRSRLMDMFKSSIKANLSECLGDNTCTGCIKKVSIEINGKKTVGRYKVYLNDSLQSMNMDISVAAVNKQGVQNGWAKVANDGTLCTASSPCVDGTRKHEARIIFDNSAPEIAALNIEESTSDANKVFLKGTLSDAFSGLQQSSYRAFILSRNKKRFLKEGTSTFLDGRKSYSDGYSFDSTGKISIPAFGVQGEDQLNGGICVSDKAANSKCVDNVELLIGKAWLKTSLGFVYSFGGLNVTLPNNPGVEDENEVNKNNGILGNLARIYSPAFPQRSTFSSYGVLYKTNYLLNGGYNNNTVGYNDRYVDIYNNYNIANYTDRYIKHDWFKVIKGLVRKNCVFLGISKCKSDFTSLNDGLSSNAAEYKVINLSGTNSLTSDIVCRNKNVIFVEGKLTISADIRKEGKESACLFVVKGSLILDDDRTRARATSIGDIDTVEAGFVISKGSSFVVKQKDESGDHDVYKWPETDGNFDRLIINGLVYSSGGAPVFERDLVFKANRKYPAEWIIYDANLMYNLSNLVGNRKIYNLECGLVSHPYCEQ